VGGEAAKPLMPEPSHMSITQFANVQVPAETSICYTCGGDWPVYSGTLPTASAAAERGGACGGSFGYSMNDHSPYLCSR